jgi:hypothetical protein
VPANSAGSSETLSYTIQLSTGSCKLMNRMGSPSDQGCQLPATCVLSLLLLSDSRLDHPTVLEDIWDIIPVRGRAAARAKLTDGWCAKKVREIQGFGRLQNVVGDAKFAIANRQPNQLRNVKSSGRCWKRGASPRLFDLFLELAGVGLLREK